MPESKPWNRSIHFVLFAINTWIIFTSIEPRKTAPAWVVGKKKVFTWKLYGMLMYIIG